LARACIDCGDNSGFLSILAAKSDKRVINANLLIIGSVLNRDEVSLMIAGRNSINGRLNSFEISSAVVSN
jgi:hypothetical protein